MNEHYLRLQEHMSKSRDLEEKLDQLRVYKQEQFRLLEEAFFRKTKGLKAAMESLSDVADGILLCVHDLARHELRAVNGMPRFKDNDGNYLASGFAVIGMGKLGGRELHFGSDLDLIFVYDRNGETQGPKALTNREYFSKLGQKIIGYLLLYTRHGYLYKVDTELRPSGQAGTLVTNLETWTAYYHEHAAFWEKQALLKARLVFADASFAKAFHGIFKRLIFLTPFPETLGAEIHRLRMRIEKELAKESERRWHYKKGYGGLVDIEFVVQYLQLKLGRVYDQLLTPNTLTALERLEATKILPLPELETLRDAYEFYRILEIYLELRFKLMDGYLDPENECVPELAGIFGLDSAEAFLDRFRRIRDNVRSIYRKVFQVGEKN